MHRFLKMAMSYCLKHDYEDGKLDYELCSLIVRGGKVLSVGYNQHSTNAFVEHYTNRVRGINREYDLSTHAEMSAVLKARGKIDLRGSTIYVVRRKRKDALYGIARPCEICGHVLFSYGIRRAFYSIDDNSYGIMKITNPGKHYNDIARDRLIKI